MPPGQSAPTRKAASWSVMSWWPSQFIARCRHLDRGCSFRIAFFAHRVSTFFGHRAFHQQCRECRHKRQHGEDPKAVAISKCGGLPVAQGLECLPAQLLRGNRRANPGKANARPCQPSGRVRRARDRAVRSFGPRSIWVPHLAACAMPNHQRRPRCDDVPNHAGSAPRHRSSPPRRAPLAGDPSCG